MSNRSRAVLLPTPADPFILIPLLERFDKVWGEEVDRMYVCVNVNTTVPFYVTGYCLDLLIEHPKVEVMYVPRMLFHGAALRLLVAMCEEKHLMLLEDDTVIYKKGEVDKCFRKLEKREADMVGSPRFSCSQGILAKSKLKYKLNYEGYGDKGPNFWPNFFFCRTSDLRKTDHNFGAAGWKEGDYIKEIDLKVTNVESGDTFVWASMQLRAMGLKPHEVPQYHSHPYDHDHLTEGTGIWDPQAGWLHIGSLTMTAEDLLPAEWPGPPEKHTANTELEKKEWERKFAWLYVLLDESKGVMGDKLSAAREVYEKRIDLYIRHLKLRRTHIVQLISAYKRLIAW